MRRTGSQPRRQWLHRAATWRMRQVRPLIWRAGRDSEAFVGTIDDRRTVAVVNLENQSARHRMTDLDLPNASLDLLRDRAPSRDTIVLQPHDAALLLGS